MRDVSPEALDATCQEVICWGNSFKSLLSLVTPDPQTGKLKQDGLIFKVHNFSATTFDVYCSFLSYINAYCAGNVHQRQRAAPVLSISVAKDSQSARISRIVEPI